MKKQAGRISAPCLRRSRMLLRRKDGPGHIKPPGVLAVGDLPPRIGGRKANAGGAGATASPRCPETVSPPSLLDARVVPIGGENRPAVALSGPKDVACHSPNRDAGMRIMPGVQPAERVR